jgi:hypothetical protein
MVNHASITSAMKAMIMKARFLELCFLWATCFSTFISAAGASCLSPPWFLQRLLSQGSPSGVCLGSRFARLPFFFATRPTTIFFRGI